jgi:hypothetical protein
MTMPWQLREGLRRRPKGAPPRPIAEQLPSINVNELPIPSLYDHKTFTAPHISLRYPHIAGARLSSQAVEFILPSLHRGQTGPSQTFQLKHIKTGFGIRHAFICNCQRPVIRLYCYHRNLACRHCTRVRYASQSLNKQTRPILQANRIQSFLDNKPRLLRRTRDRLQKRLGEKAMMAQGRLRTRASSLWE